MVFEHVESHRLDPEDITYIPELRRRVRGEHVPAREAAKCFPVTPPPAPPSLSRKELAGLRAVFQRLDVDRDGWLSASDLYRAMRLHGAGGLRVSRKEARDMLWEVSSCPGPGLTFEGFTGAYARAKEDNDGKEPRRLYHYIVYSLMDMNASGTVTTDEVYRHFFSYVDDRDLVSGTAWLLDTMPRGEAEDMSPGLFVRFMQSGALASAPDLRSKRKARPSSAPAAQDSRRQQRGVTFAAQHAEPYGRQQAEPPSPLNRSSSSSRQQAESPSPLGTPSPTAKDKYLQATAELRRDKALAEQGVHVPGSPFSKQDSAGEWSSTARRASMLDTQAIRKARHCTLSGITDVTGQSLKDLHKGRSAQQKISHRRGVLIAPDPLADDAEFSLEAAMQRARCLRPTTDQPSHE